jgi:drug/metabolite transporter (DMT)-like permease
MQKILGPLALTGAAAGFALFGVLIRVMGETFTPVAQVSARMCVAAALLTLLHMLFRKMPPLTSRQKMFAILAGVGGAIEVSLFTYAILVTTLASTLFLLYATSLVVSVFAATAIFHEKITMQKIIAVVCTLAGITVYTGGGGNDVFTYGALAALGSGVMYGINNMLGKALSGADALAAIQYKFVTGAALTACAAYIFGESGVHDFSYAVLGVCVLFGAMLVVVNRFLFYGFKHTEVNTASVILSTELVFATVIGVTLYGETLSLYEAFGGLLILVGSIVAAGVWGTKKR